MANKPYKKFRKPTDDYQPVGDEQVLSKSLDGLELATDTLEKLKGVEILTVNDLVKCQMRHLFRIPGMSKKNVFELLKKVQSLGLDFRRVEKPPVEENKTQLNATNVEFGEGIPKPKAKFEKQDKQAQKKRQNETLINTQKRENQIVKQPNQPKAQPKSAQREKINSHDINVDYKKNKSDRYSEKEREYDYKSKEEKKKSIALPPLENADGLYKFYKQGKWGYKNTNGMVVIQPTFDEAFNFSEGLACVELSERVGFINKIGEVVIPIIYDSACSFSEGTASVTLDGRSGYIDKSGEYVFPLNFEAATAFINGISLVKKDGKWGYLDKVTGDIRLR